ncbi:MAG: NFYB/HAP3 family transcription factor subunit [Candidatus Marsarchaeota archaeon]|nr:NFYB/HAP3 family transcription factor subunit [Candidatus Marsarchaeota archaeon]MCL5112751.1 NFYB/HAP3 family transcription factor subunit [Candidatus Marsarchaeota archaeon]
MYMPEAAVRKLLKEAGASRISGDAVKKIQEHIDSIAFQLAKKSVSLSKHAKRKTVEVADVKLALK